jgi:MFS family permease
MVYALAPAYGKTTLEASARGYGFMIGAMGTGAILGVYVLKRLRPLLRPRLLIGATACLYAVSALGLSQAHGVVTATILFLPAGVGWTGTFASLSALVQIWTPERLRARIIAVYTMLHFALWALGSTLGGLLADHAGVRVAMLAGAAVCLGTGLVTARLPLPSSFVGPGEPEGLRPGEDAPPSRSDARASAA